MSSSVALFALALLPTVAARTALLVVDVQDCFLEANTTSGATGSLSVTASHIIPLINQLRAERSCMFDEVIFTQDYHPPNHISFASAHGLAPFAHLSGKGALPLTCITPTSGNMADASCCPSYYLNPSAFDCSQVLCPGNDFEYDVNNSELVSGSPACTTCQSNPDSCFSTYQEMWTDHCVQTGDSTYPPSLDKRAGDLVVQKGGNQFVDAYSAFYDNTQNLKTSLDAELQARSIDTLYVTGIATDFCVKMTTRDALANITADYTVNVISDATAAVMGDTGFNDALTYMEQQGATMYTVAQVLDMECPVDETSSDAARTSLLWSVGIVLAFAQLLAARSA